MTNARLAYRLLGLHADAPLSPPAMAAGLRVTFAPAHEHTPALDAFADRLRGALARAGVEVVPYVDALTERGKIQPDIVTIEQGDGDDDALAIRRVSSLYRNPLIGLFDRPPPVAPDAGLQETLDAIVGVLAWSQVHIPVFVHDGRWTVCTMNGAVIDAGDADDLDAAVLDTFVPKLAAQVQPPDPATITVRPGALDLGPLAAHVDDFVTGARAWDASGLMLAHTSLDQLEYRNRLFRRLVATYLDHRTGMSYGFLARQLPVDVAPARRLADAPADVAGLDWDERPVRELDGGWTARVTLAGTDWLAAVPDVSVLGTRSGCDKVHLVPERDLVRLTLSRGQIVFDTPPDTGGDCRPSYDTLAILAHAVGNALAASVLRAHDPEDAFAHALAGEGLALAHWHGYPDEGATPDGFVRHGTANPPVSCSTPQSAAFALVGKLAALGQRIEAGGPYLGDVHVEPHHGTNVSGRMTLAQAAEWAEAASAVASPARV
ncbi:hypothetical protein [Rubrivirga sp. IMCC45206]|uniref:hypothetical protein n=1 Tax=Rubrivirga sp. IMCC45206 TaxID=3391614 RepID=UPI0039901574